MKTFRLGFLITTVAICGCERTEEREEAHKVEWKPKIHYHSCEHRRPG